MKIRRKIVIREYQVFVKVEGLWEAGLKVLLCLRRRCFENY